MASAKPPQFALLGVDNYATWAVRMRMFLVHKGLGHTIVQQEGFEVTAEDSVNALALIGLHVEDPHLHAISVCNTALEAWQMLEATYKGKSQARVLQLRRELTALKKGAAEPLTVYVARAQALAADLTAAGHAVQPTEVAYAVLAGLPHEYDMAVTVLETTGQELTVQSLLPRLLPIEQRVRAAGDQDSAALVARFGARGGQSSAREQRCFRCGKPGHVAAECSKPDMRKCYLCGKPGHVAKHCTAGSGDVMAQVAFVAAHDLDGSWVLDSGSSNHLTPDRASFSTYEKLAAPVHVTFGNGERAQAVGRGDVPLVVGNTQVTLTAVLHVPEARVNLVSVRRVVGTGARVEFGDGTCSITKGGKLLMSAQQRGGLWCLSASRGPSALTAGDAALIARSTPETAQLWHQRFGHLSYPGLAALKQQDMVDGIKVPAADFVRAGETPCDTCAQAKQARQPFPDSNTTTTKQLELVHMDVCGPMPVESLGGSRYFATFLDDYSRFSVVVPVRAKADVPAVVQRTLALLETQTGGKVVAVRTDRGGEYVNRELSAWFGERGVQHQLTAPYTPQQNGCAERLNRVITEGARADLLGAGQPPELWAEAVVSINYIRNRSPTSSGPGTPWERFFGKRPDVSNLRVFGARAYVHVPQQLRRKLDPVSQPGIMVGYSATSKAYRILLDGTGKVVESRDVVFDEGQVGGGSRGSSGSTMGSAGWDAWEEDDQLPRAPAPPAPEPPPAAPAVAEGDAAQRGRALSRSASEAGAGDVRGEPVARGEGQPASAPEQRRYPARDRNAPGSWYAVNFAGDNQELSDEPGTVEEALARPDGDKFREAMDEEVASLRAHQTW